MKPPNCPNCGKAMEVYGERAMSLDSISPLWGCPTFCPRVREDTSESVDDDREELSA